MKRKDDLPETKEETKTETAEDSQQASDSHWSTGRSAVSDRVSRELDEEYEPGVIYRIRDAMSRIEPDYGEIDNKWGEVWIHLAGISSRSVGPPRYLEAFADVPVDDATTLYYLFLDVWVWNQRMLEHLHLLQRHLRAFIELGFDRHGVPDPPKSNIADYSYRDVLETWKKFDAPLRERLPVLFTTRGAETMRISLVQLHVDFIAYREVYVRMLNAVNAHDVILCLVDMLGLLARIQVNGRYVDRRGLLVRDPNPDDEDEDE